MKKISKANDEKVAKDIRGRFIHSVVFCDDGNVHAKFQLNHKIDAESCVEAYEGKVTSDGVQEGQVIVWLGDEMLTDL